MGNDSTNGGSGQKNEVPGIVPSNDEDARNRFEAILGRLKEATGTSTDSELAKAMGLGQQSVSGARKKNQLPPVWITRISEELGVSADWLLFGEGATMRHANLDPKGGLDLDEFDYIPMSHAELSAGGGSVVLQEGFKNRFAFRRDWLYRVGLSKKNAVMMVVRGDSMEPTLENHDTVIVDLTRTRIDTGSIYAVNIGDDLLTIKRLESRGRVVRIISDNPQYEPYEMDIQDIRVIGQVVWYARQLVWNSYD